METPNQIQISATKVNAAEISQASTKLKLMKKSISSLICTLQAHEEKR